MKMALKKYNTNKIYLLLFFWTACMQNLSLVSFGGFALKLYHVVALLYLPFLLKKKIRLLPKPIAGFYILLFFITVSNAFQWGINSFLFNYIFAIYALIIIINIGKEFTQNDWLDIIRVVAVVMSVLIWIKMAVNYHAVIDFIRDPYRGHPELDTFFGGGVNLEASYLAMMAPAFITDKNLKRRLMYIASCVLICVLYSSRSALLICLISIGVILINEKKKKLFLLLIPFGIIGMIYAYTKIDLSFFLDRFSSISTESGVLGRFRMWIYAWDLFWNRPIGYGIGNSIPALKAFTGVFYSESNFHNLYIQMFIDLGFLGGVYYCGLVLYFFIMENKRIVKKPLALMLALYFFACLLEFRGAEIIIYFYLGAYLQQISKGKEMRRASENVSYM